ncbi:hypothetical protein Taro_018363 [Colocasia esculenta]|uniref:X8 domain-containing protein n=1 Tax=Colocasia esculenta TaxID=4460 RepID=A0A843V268_COLES|nr:hypothetical protein [Colocasia esculenta]
MAGNMRRTWGRGSQLICISKGVPVAEATTSSASESRRALGLFARCLTSSNESGDRVGTKIPPLPKRNDILHSGATIYAKTLYVAVGNEPFLETYNGSFLGTTFPALQNIQSALIKAGLSSQVKVTVPLNADVYSTSTSLPSGGDFRANIHDLMINIVKFLSDNAGAFTVNIYPFISLYDDPNFPVEYAFFDGNSAAINDGGTSYTNVFDANHDTLVWALQKNGYANLPIIIGEVGWPTDGDVNANLQYAQRFNQGFMTRVLSGRGTPLRPGPLDAYLFSLIDEDEKSIQPGNFERHWGIFGYDGRPKYLLNLGAANSSGLVRARNIGYLDKKWCIMKPSVSSSDSRLPDSVGYACANADCTSLGYRTSCSDLDVRGNISYAFNSYYQKNDQDDQACQFPGVSVITTNDPSTQTCRFEIMIDTLSSAAPSGKYTRHQLVVVLAMVLCSLLHVMASFL